MNTHINFSLSLIKGERQLIFQATAEMPDALETPVSPQETEGGPPPMIESPEEAKRAAETIIKTIDQDMHPRLQELREFIMKIFDMLKSIMSSLQGIIRSKDESPELINTITTQFRTLNTPSASDHPLASNQETPPQTYTNPFASFIPPSWRNPLSSSAGQAQKNIPSRGTQKKPQTDERFAHASMTLSVEDYADLFPEEDAMNQGTTDNCFWVTAMEGIRQSMAAGGSDEWDELMRMNIKRDGSSYIVRLPMGSPNAEEYLVQGEDLDDEDAVQGDKGWKVLEAAFTLKMAGRDENGRLRRDAIKKDYTDTALHHMIYGVHTDRIRRKEDAISFLKNFREEDIASVGQEDTRLPRGARIAGTDFLANHAYTVSSVDQEHELVTIMDPYTREESTLSYESFMQTFNLLMTGKIDENTIFRNIA